MSVSSLPPSPTAVLAPERAQDEARVQALIEQAFGPGRFAKAAERLREGSRPALDLSFVAWAGDEVVGCVRLWPIRIGGAPALLLGPFAVEDPWRSRGLGGQMIEAACEAARVRGDALILLIGDEPYFQRFGFVQPSPGQIRLPGPVDRRRVLWLNLSGAELPAGDVQRAAEA